MIQKLYKNTISKKLLTWFDEFGRKDLPWQKNTTPYRVWVSEIMLQQTQVSAVIPYYLRFMAQFPSLKSLATANIDEVLQLWAGLGYYTRARNLHRSAQFIYENFNGRFPRSTAELQQLPGIGRSTAGAIVSIAMNIRAPILDGNVKRVLTRVKAIEGWPGKTDVLNQLWDIADYHTPNERIADYTQAIMDLGAMICTRTKPQCHQCPLQKNCLAFNTQEQHSFPQSKPKKTLPVKSNYFLMLVNQDKQVLLEKRPPAGIWGGLWSLPQSTIDDDINSWCMEKYGYGINDYQTWETFRHSFSHYHLDITPVLVNISNPLPCIMENNSEVWYKVEHAIKKGVATPIKKLLKQLSERIK